MASAISLISSKPIIPFVHVKDNKDIRKISLYNTVTMQFGNDVHSEKRHVEMSVANDGDIETLIRVVIDFYGIGRLRNLS